MPLGVCETRKLPSVEYRKLAAAVIGEATRQVLCLDMHRARLESHRKREQSALKRGDIEDASHRAIKCRCLEVEIQREEDALRWFMSDHSNLGFWAAVLGHTADYYRRNLERLLSSPSSQAAARRRAGGKRRTKQ